MKRVLILLTVALLMLSMLAVSSPAFAKITQVTRNPQGHETQGTPGKAQTTQNENPAGHAPPGQNP